MAVSNRRRDTRIRNTQLNNSIDPLEPRTLLAAPIFDADLGQLTYSGTDQADTVVISRDRRRASKVVVIIDGQGYKFVSRAVRTVLVNAGAGDDKVVVNSKWGTVSQRMVLLGGLGDDTLGGSLGNDDLRGDAGNDLLTGAGGNDLLEGGAGQDALHGARGNDTLRGGDDDDNLSDGRGNNTHDGGNGVDTINGTRETPGGGGGGGGDTGARPDLQIKTKAETSYAGNDQYNTTGANQSESAPGAFYPTIYHLRIQNDGEGPDSFDLTGTAGDPGKWRVRFYESQATAYDGAANVTQNFTNPGWNAWNTGVIAPGGFKDFRMEVVALMPGARGGDAKKVNVVARSRSNPDRTDVVSATTTYTTARHLELRRLNFDASGQYLLTIHNFGNVPDRARVSGPRSGQGYAVRYFDAHVGGENVSGDVGSGGWLSPVIAPGDEIQLKVVIDSDTGGTHSVQVDVHSAGDNALKDHAVVTNRPPADTTPNFFPIGVWAQPKKDFDKWKSRGINTLVMYEGHAATVDEWTAAAAERQMWMIRRPRPNPADDVNQPFLLAWAHPDEPDIPSTQHPIEFIRQQFQRMRAADPDRPIFTNYSGGYVNAWQGATGRAAYEQFLANTDWAGSSIYPVTGWDRPDMLYASGRAVDRLEKWSQGKPQFAVIETGDQELPWAPREIPGVTPGEFRAQFWDAIIRGARGIVYFPQKFKPNFSYDNTPPEIVEEMITQHARVKAIEQAILSPSDPPSLGVTLNSPLEATWRSHGGKKYFIVLNSSDRPLTNVNVRLHGIGSADSAAVSSEKRTVAIDGGVITDDFAPYATHVYVVD